MAKPKNTKKIKNVIDKWKKLALALSLVLVLNVFFNVGIETFYDQPEWDEYCSEDLWSGGFDTQVACESVGGRWNEDSYARSPEFEKSFYCDATYSCQMAYEDDLSVYNRNVFIVLTALGTLVVVLSLYVAGPSAVVNGLMYGGVLSILVGVMRYWSDMDDYLRFIVSGVMLVILILVGMKKLKDD